MASSSPYATYTEGLYCSICCELNHQIALDCGHSCCESCAKSLIEHCPARQSRRKHVQCPMCKENTRVPRAGMLQNISLNSIIDTFKPYEDEFTMNLCKLHFLPANLVCLTCSSDIPARESGRICALCYTSVHMTHNVSKLDAPINEVEAILESIKSSDDSPEEVEDVVEMECSSPEINDRGIATDSGKDSTNAARLLSSSHLDTTNIRNGDVKPLSFDFSAGRPHLLAFCKRVGHCNVPLDYVVTDDCNNNTNAGDQTDPSSSFPLGQWLETAKERMRCNLLKGGDLDTMEILWKCGRLEIYPEENS